MLQGGKKGESIFVKQTDKSNIRIMLARGIIRDWNMKLKGGGLEMGYCGIMRVFQKNCLNPNFVIPYDYGFFDFKN